MLYSKRTVESDALKALFKRTMGRLGTNIDESINGQGPVDLQPLMRWMLCDIMSHIVYGRKHALSLLESSEQRGAMQIDFKWQDEKVLGFDALMSALFPRLWLSLSKNKLVTKILGPRFPENLYMVEVAASALNDALEACVDDQSHPESLLECMLNRYREVGPTEACPDMDYIFSECLDHFWAGVGTATDAVLGLLYQLSLPANETRQARLREELRQVDALTDAFSTSSRRLKTHNYVDCIIRETLAPLSSHSHLLGSPSNESRN